MRLARAAVIFSLGFFAIAAQSLLFRQFLTAFEGNELAIGVFFCSWLLWVTVGAWLARAVHPLAAALSGRFRGIALLYLPAFVVQYMLVGQARELAGVAPYEQFPLLAMIGVCVAANSPVSLLTGALFTWACRWAAGAGDGSPDAALTPARVYMLEALGAAAGGVWATLWLARGVPVETVFLLSAIVVAAAGLQPNLGGLARAAGVAALALAVAFGAGDLWSAHSNQRQWRRLIPAGYEGRVSTAQAEYLYGEHDGQFTVMAWGSVCETPFTLSQGAEDAAAILPQCPHARRVLVLGAGAYPLCTVLCSLPQIERVAWFHPDPAYPPRLAQLLREHGHTVPEKLLPCGSDARTWLQHAADQYDLVILSLPDTTTLVLNRYSTAEFFAEAKRALAPGGVMATRVPGGANYLASESAVLGLSMMTTLETAFRNTALKPGESSWFFASDGDTLMNAPMPVARRWMRIEGAEAWYPAEGVRDFYRRGRVMRQLDAYQAARAAVPSDVLLNLDRSPRALLFGILLELHAVELRVLVDDPRPAVNADNRNDAAALVRECVQLLSERIELVLIRDNGQRHHLLVGHVALEARRLQRGQQLRGLAPEPRRHDFQRRRALCNVILFLTHLSLLLLVLFWIRRRGTPAPQVLLLCLPRSVLAAGSSLRRLPASLRAPNPCSASNLRVSYRPGQSGFPRPAFRA